MKKQDIIDFVSKRTGLTAAQSKAATETTIRAIKYYISNGEPVYLRDFGSFIVKKRAKKIARNISKNTALVVPEHYIPAFKPAPGFKKAVKKFHENKYSHGKNI